MTLTETNGAIERFRKAPGQFQATFATPLKCLQPFVVTIFSAQVPLQSGSVTIDKVVFEPKHLIDLMAKHALPVQSGHNWSLTTTNQTEMVDLLQAALSDWVDFAFIPAPKSFSVYADHDEYTTFYANTHANLQRLIDALRGGGFKRIESYERCL